MQSVIDEILGDFVCIVFIGPTRSISFSYTSHSSWVFQSSRLNAFPRSCPWVTEYLGGSVKQRRSTPEIPGSIPVAQAGPDPRGSDLVSKEFAGTRSVGPFDDSNQVTHSSCGSPCIRTHPSRLGDRPTCARLTRAGRARAGSERGPVRQAHAVRSRQISSRASTPPPRRSFRPRTPPRRVSSAPFREFPALVLNASLSIAGTRRGASAGRRRARERSVPRPRAMPSTMRLPALYDSGNRRWTRARSPRARRRAWAPRTTAPGARSGSRRIRARRTSRRSSSRASIASRTRGPSSARRTRATCSRRTRRRSSRSSSAPSGRARRARAPLVLVRPLRRDPLVRPRDAPGASARPRAPRSVRERRAVADVDRLTGASARGANRSTFGRQPTHRDATVFPAARIDKALPREHARRGAHAVPRQRLRRRQYAGAYSPTGRSF